MKDSILISKKENINFSQTVSLKSFLNMDIFYNHNFSKELKINGYLISKKENTYFFKKTSSFKINDIMNIVSYISNDEKLHYILHKYINEINELQKNKLKITSSLEKVISYIYFDVLLLIEIASFKHNNRLDYSKEKKMINKITGLNLIYSKKIEKENNKKYKRTHIANRSKNSIFFTKEHSSKKITSLIKKQCLLINLNELEIPYNYNKIKTLNLLKTFNKILCDIKLEKRDFSLRFKKIAHYKKTGLYIKNAKTLIVDPRNTTTIFHELGHFIYENNYPININGLEINSKNIKEIIKNNEKKYETKIINHKIEEVNKNSEIFAYYFEEEIIKIINLENINNALL